MKINPHKIASYITENPDEFNEEDFTEEEIRALVAQERSVEQARDVDNQRHLDDLHDAQSELDSLDLADRGNAPNAYRTRQFALEDKVELITNILKRNGVLESSEKEILERKLDENFPEARSKEVVEFEGRKYQRRFFPLRYSRSRKTVIKWGKYWEHLLTGIDSEDAEIRRMYSDHMKNHTADRQREIAQQLRATARHF